MELDNGSAHLPQGGNWAPDPIEGSTMLRWFVCGQPTDWVAARAYPSLHPQSKPVRRTLNFLTTNTGASDLARPTGAQGAASLTDSGFENIRMLKSEVRAEAVESTTRIRRQTASLRHTLASFERRIIEQRNEAAEAERGRKLAAVGVLRRAVLYEDRIELPGETHELTPDVRAETRQYGDKDVVQGWVIKTTHDRREIQLDVEGPDWSSTVHFEMKWSLSDSRAIHEFAATVNKAAKRSDRARAEIAERSANAKTLLLNRLRDTEMAVAEIEAAANFSGDELLSKAIALATVAGNAPRATGRGERKLIKRAEKTAASVRVSLQSVLHELESTRTRLKVAVREAEEEALQLETSNNEQAGAVGNGSFARSELSARQADTPSNPAVEVRDSRLEKLKDLKELRDILSDEEFEAEKKRILSEP